MKYSFLTVIIVLSVQLSFAQNVEVVKFGDLQRKMLNTDSPLTIFNFWATWCGPCIKEIPYFQSIDRADQDVKVYLVSVDFQSELERVKKFVDKKSLTSDVLFLDEKNPDTYMSKVSTKWTGAIPATLFVTDLGKTYFYEKAFTKEQLEYTVKKHLN